MNSLPFMSCGKHYSRCLRDHDTIILLAGARAGKEAGEALAASGNPYLPHRLLAYQAAPVRVSATVSSTMASASSRRTVGF